MKKITLVLFLIAVSAVADVNPVATKLARDREYSLTGVCDGSYGTCNY